MPLPPLTAQGTIRLPVALLAQLISNSRRIVGVSVTQSSHEVVSIGPPKYALPFVLHTGSLLTPEQLKAIVDEQAAGALVLGGSGLFRADGTTHFGVRKLISAVQHISYKGGDWLPTPQPQTHMQPPPILLCREGNDDAATMVTEFVKRHAGIAAFPALTRETHSSAY